MADHESHHEDEHGGGHGGGGHGGGNHGGGGHEEHEGAPEWLISFADNVALIMGFFVILLAMNLKPASAGASGPSSEEGTGKPTPTVETLDMAIAIREAFNNPVRLDSNDPKDLPLVQRLAQRKAINEGGHGVGDKERDGRAITPRDDRGLEETILFDGGCVRLDEEGVEALDRAARRLKGTRFVIEVRGHCSAAEAYDKADRGMRLSYDRAAAVAAELDARGVKWARLKLIANADADRVNAVAYDNAAQRANQRVQVVSTDRVAPDFDEESTAKE